MCDSKINMPYSVPCGSKTHVKYTDNVTGETFLVPKDGKNSNYNTHDLTKKLYKEYNCERCGILVVVRTGNPLTRRFCSKACERIPRIKKSCGNCGNDFTTIEGGYGSTKEQEFCSNNCYETSTKKRRNGRYANSRRQINLNPPKDMEKKCANEKCSVIMKLRDTKRDRARIYCSSECKPLSDGFLNGGRRKGSGDPNLKERRSCSGCGKKFTVYKKSSIKNCSKSCGAKNRQK